MWGSLEHFHFQPNPPNPAPKLTSALALSPPTSASAWARPGQVTGTGQLGTGVWMFLILLKAHTEEMLGGRKDPALGRMQKSIHRRPHR